MGTLPLVLQLIHNHRTGERCDEHPIPHQLRTEDCLQ